VENVVSLEARFRLRRSDDLEIDIDLSIPPGATAALLGPNGAGKSTFVATVAGLLPIDSGRVALDERVLDDPDSGVFVAAEKRNIGVVFQDYLLFPHLSAIENVAFGLRSRGVARGEALDLSRKWLARMGLETMRERKPKDLSGGEAQRVALARALVGAPDVLLLDEPLSALDVAARSSMRHLLQEHLEAFAGPRLLITHDPTEAFLLADDIHVMESGKTTQSGAANDIRLRPATPYVADLAGANFARGLAENGVVDVDGHRLFVADDEVEGPVLVTIPPTAVAVHTTRPTGSPRNTWETRVAIVERLGGRVRLRTEGPLQLTVELTAAATDELGLDPGKEIWLAVKATEIGLQPDQ
jgi:molybdate transport system ATP-binding protein